MEKKKLLIADAAEEFRLALADMLQGTYHVRSCRTGKEALALLRSFEPDVMVLDLMLPELDGISLLQSASAEGLCPMVLATTRFSSSYVFDSTDHLGIEYVMMKPCDLRATIARIHDLSRRIRHSTSVSEDPRTQTAALLTALNMPTKLDGYDYLLEIIPSEVRRPGQSFTKELYPSAGAIFGVDKSNVERSIRNAIAAAWNHRDEQVWLRFFSPESDGSLRRPTNSTFICQLANAIRMNSGIENL